MVTEWLSNPSRYILKVNQTPHQNPYFDSCARECFPALRMGCSRVSICVTIGSFHGMSPFVIGYSISNKGNKGKHNFRRKHLLPFSQCSPS